MGNARTQKRRIAPEAPKEKPLPGLEVPAAVIDALVGYGLQTSAGATLMNIWRSEPTRSEIHPSKGNATLIVGPGRILLAPQQKAPPEG